MGQGRTNELYTFRGRNPYIRFLGETSVPIINGDLEAEIWESPHCSSLKISWPTDRSADQEFRLCVREGTVVLVQIHLRLRTCSLGTPALIRLCHRIQHHKCVTISSKNFEEVREFPLQRSPLQSQSSS